jgi:uncharacterized protein involved in type VI secretion and phage assembly
MAGMGRGTYFIPQVGDEVLVAFEHGDVRSPFVIGSLWNSMDRPPATSPTDAITKRLIRTPLGHEVELDDALQTVTVTTTTRQRIELGPDAITVQTSAGASSIELGVDGAVKVRGTSITLDALDSVTVKAAKSVEASSLGTTSVSAGARCEIKGSMVTIN